MSERESAEDARWCRALGGRLLAMDMVIDFGLRRLVNLIV